MSLLRPSLRPWLWVAVAGGAWWLLEVRASEGGFPWVPVGAGFLLTVEGAYWLFNQSPYRDEDVEFDPSQVPSIAALHSEASGAQLEEESPPAPRTGEPRRS